MATAIILRRNVPIHRARREMAGAIGEWAARDAVHVIPERNPYIEQAAPDLAAALRGPVGKMLLAGNTASIVEILATSIHSGRRTHSTAWLVLAARDKAPCVVIVSTSPAGAHVGGWSPALQRYEEIADLDIESRLTEPGRFVVVEVRTPDDALFRPFQITAAPCWILESIWDDSLDARIYRDVEKSRPGRPGDMLPDRAWRPLPSLFGHSPTSRKIRCARIVLQRTYGARTAESFKGRLRVAISRELICAFEADDIATAIALVPEHAAVLSKAIS